MKVKSVDITLSLSADEFTWFMAWMEHPKDWNYEEIKDIAKAISCTLKEL